MLTYSADSSAEPEIAWRLVAEPGRWSRWAPHVRGARGLGEPEVQTGADGQAVLVGGVPLRARVIAKQSQRFWTWEVGPVRLRHRVRARPGGCRVAVDIEAPFPVEALARVTYGPLVAMLMANLARVAAEDARRAQRQTRREEHRRAAAGG